MDVAQNCVGFPSTKDSYDISVDAAKEHCHGSAGAEGACGHFFREEADRLTNSLDAGADCCCDVLAFEDAPLCTVMVACDRNMCRGALTS